MWIFRCLVRRIYLTRARELRGYRHVLSNIGETLNIWTVQDRLFQNLPRPIVQGYYERRISQYAMAALKSSDHRIANWAVHQQLVRLTDEAFFRKYRVTKKEAVERMEEYCTQSVGPGEFELGSIVRSEHKYGNCEITILREMGSGRPLVVGFRMQPTQIDMRCMRYLKSGCLPPFRWRHVPIKIGIGKARDPFGGNSKDFRLLRSSYE